MILRHYSKKKLYELNTANGKVKKISQACEDKDIPFGLMYKYLGKCFTIYKENGLPILQKNSQKLPLDNFHKVRVKGSLFREFSISRDGKLIFQHKYIAPIGAWIASYLDPTYDLMDAELDDFFIFVAGHSMFSDIQTHPFTSN